MKPEKNTKSKTGALNPFLDARRNTQANDKQGNFEVTGEYNGVIFINDAASDSVMRVRASLETISSPVLLITGHVNANPNFRELSDVIRKKVKAVIYMGTEQESIIRSCTAREILFVTAHTMEEALDYAVKFCKRGDAVIYSPAGTAGTGLPSNNGLGTEFKKAFHKLAGKYYR